jgi:glyceraldehyde-3-phosphate dehydrogenase/erythrose-4-phosphate dehydrogenase
VQSKNIHVVGIGTIGEPLLGILTSLRSELGIDRITFHKQVPRLADRPKLRALISRGATLTATPETMDLFRDLGLEPAMTHEDAIEGAQVVIDCTPVGNDNKAELYRDFDDGNRVFIAQGSATGFGKPYARGINDTTLIRGEDRFVQVVSCNSHNIAVLLKTIAGVSGERVPQGETAQLDSARFVCMRRASDISEETGFVSAPTVGDHADPRYGTHHAADAANLFRTLGHELNIFSSAMSLNTQYMHSIHFSVTLKHAITRQQVLERLRQDPLVSMTAKHTSSTIFSFGRDHGIYGRILNQTVVCAPTVTVRDDNEVLGFCFTPQDGNSLISSISAAMWQLHGQRHHESLQCLKRYCFPEI